jgi:hypothetical protein
MAGLTPRWRKSSHSVDNGNANCVEVGSVPGTVLVRDTTDRDGETLTLDARAWRRFTTRIRETTEP